MVWGWLVQKYWLQNTIGYAAVVVITGTTVLVPYHLVTSLQLIWRSSRCHQQVPNLQMKCSDLTGMRGYQDSSPSNSHQVTCLDEIFVLTLLMLRPVPIFCLLLLVSSGCARPITGQVTSVTWPVIEHSLSLLRARDRKWAQNVLSKLGQYHDSRCPHFNITKPSAAMVSTVCYVDIFIFLDKIWWLCLVPTSTTRFASDMGCRIAKRLRGLYKELIFMNNDI